MISREKVFNAINSEREYQSKKWGFRQDDGTFLEAHHTTEEYLLYMQSYMTKAIDEATMNPGDKKALEILRKIVGLGVACFEQNGVEFRKIDKAMINARDGKPV